MAITDSKVIGFTAALEGQAQANSRQSVHLMSATHAAMGATLVGDPKAGAQQIAPEDAHPHILKLLRLEAALNLHKILTEEAKGVADKDYKDILALISKLKTAIDSGNADYMQDAKERIKESRGQLADVIQTNAVHMESGNNVEILSSNEIRLLKSVLWRAGTAIRWEAPLIVDNAHTRIMLAHTMMHEADLLIQRAQNLMASVRDQYGLSAKDISLVAAEKLHVSAEDLEMATVNVKILADGSADVKVNGPINLVASGDVTLKSTGGKVKINPTSTPSQTMPERLDDTDRPIARTKGKKHLELPQWKGMSPIPAYVTPDDEVEIQKKGEV